MVRKKFVAAGVLVDFLATTKVVYLLPQKLPVNATDGVADIVKGVLILSSAELKLYFVKSKI
jgi:hypothetical protein